MSDENEPKIIIPDEAELPEVDELQAEGQPKLPPALPVLPAGANVIFPGMMVPLIFSNERTIRCVDETVVNDRLVVLATQRDPEEEDPAPDGLYDVGCAAAILKMLKFPDGTTRILAQGMARVTIGEYTQIDPFLMANIEQAEETGETSARTRALVSNLSAQFQKLVGLMPNVADEVKVAALNIKEPGKLADFITSNLNIKPAEKQTVLEEFNIEARLQKVTGLVAREMDVLELGSRIQKEVQSEMTKRQREYYLRQQLKAIRQELGEADEQGQEIEELRQQIEEADMTEEAREIAEKELDRLARMSPNAAEYSVARTYLDWLIALPWTRESEDKLDVKEAKRVLDEDHHDLEKIKQRILEYLAVRKLKPRGKGPILCFIGPPGVGKTSLGRSIARALGRQFLRLSLGGIRDEAEIRGHRRTYVGALPGRIIQGIRKADTRNPLFMLDEVDKLGRDFRGDPSSALLEVLDPEQNDTFSDHYLEVPFDLSSVMFITTGNLLDPIPPALKDRMEIIQLPGYTYDDKLQIAKKHLLPKQVDENGLDSKQVQISDAALKKMISSYTREAGVRNLERTIGTVCHKVAKYVAEGGDEKQSITVRNLHDYLGPVKFFPEVAERTEQPGVATGMAWTASGGEILFVESTRMPGKKGLTLTGQLGDVMKESAQAALSYTRARADRFGIAPGFFQDSDVHIHVPAGAIPKDGPSAGVTMAVSLISLLTGVPIKDRVAMTGEITLRGRVMPVGGIKEKVLAAHRAGIRTVVLPEKNEKDLEDIPEEIRDAIEFVFVDTIEDAVDAAFPEGALEERRAEKQSGEAAG
ncbi:MAG: endopeptidase La [Planctomycetota bacterium]